MKNNIPVSVLSIPDELIFEILTYLPIKSLLRFRCVCERWRSTISDPSFAEAHRSRSAAAALLLSVPDLLSRRHHRKYTLVSVEKGEARLPLLPGIEFSCRNISQSVNGLVCIYEQYEGNYYNYLESEPEPSPPRVIVYNPSTREHVTLPPPALIFPHPVFGLQCNSLGFDPSIKTYKVLREWMIGLQGGCRYEILTLGGGAWRIIEDGPVYGLTTKGICLNGTIYWAKTKTMSIVDGEDIPDLVSQNIIIAFDVGEEKFRDVPVPPAGGRVWNNSVAWNMIEIGGYIAIVDFYVHMVGSNSNVMTMWKLEDSINGIWSKRKFFLPEFCISSYQLPYILRSPFVTSINNNGEITLIPFVTSINNGEMTLISSWLLMDWYVFHYNLEEESVRIEFITRSPENDWTGSFPCIEGCDISVYKESLTSLREICRL